MIWKKNIDQMVSPVSDGNDRVQGLVINSAVGDVCILNAYMPCRGAPVMLRIIIGMFLLK